MRGLRAVLAVLAVLLPASGARAHPVGKADRLHWEPPCAIAYPDGDVFERLKPHHCDYLLAHDAGERERFNRDFTLSQQQAFLMRNDDEADTALKQYKALFEETALEKLPKAHEAAARRIVEYKARLKQEFPALAAPFGGKEAYQKDLDDRLAQLDGRLKQEEGKLDDNQKAILARQKEKFEGEDAKGSAKTLKTSGEAFGKHGADQAALGRERFDGNALRGAPAEPGKAGPAKVGDGAGAGQLAKGAALSDGVQRQIQRKADQGRVPQPQYQGERLGDASESRGAVGTILDYKRGLFPAEPGKNPHKKFSEERIVADDKVSLEARREAQKVVEGMLRKADPRVAQNLLDNNVKLVIVPKGANLADYAPSLKDQKTIDGRCFTLCYNPKTRRNEVGEVKAVADIPLKDGSVAALVPEENLIGKGPKDSRGFPKDFTTVHEFGHMVELYGLPKTTSLKDKISDWRGASDSERLPTLGEVEQTYRDSVSGSGMDAYGKSDHREFFAQYTASWFGKHNNGITAEQLKRSDPGMYEKMERIYGPPTDIG